MSANSEVKTGLVLPVITTRYILKLVDRVISTVHIKNYHICIVNNGQIEVAEYLAGHKWPDNVSIVNLPENRCFAGSHNAGWKYLLQKFPEVKYLGSLSDDTIPRDGWLDNLIESLEKYPKTALAVPVIEEEAGIFHLRGARLFKRLKGLGIFKLNDLCIYEYDDSSTIKCKGFRAEKDTFVPVIRGVCFLTDAKILQEVNFFDESFKNSCEDVDLCLKILTGGYRMVLSSHSRVFHLGGMSIGLKKAGTNYSISHALLDKKWGTNISRYNNIDKEGFLRP